MPAVRERRRAVLLLLAAILLCDGLAGHSSVAAVPVLTSAAPAAGAADATVAAGHGPSWDTTRPKGEVCGAAPACLR